MSIPLQSVTPEQLAEQTGIDVTDARRIVGHVHRLGILPDKTPSGIRRGAFERVRELGSVPELVVVERLHSQCDPFVKLLLALPDGNVIETVRWPLERPERWSICVSSQCGCAMACTFCATGANGLLRNLKAWEIVEQVRIARDEIPTGHRIRGVVFQGMGEPLANVDEVLQAIRVLSEPSALAIDRKAITVSTVGLPAGIRRLAIEFPEVRLAISLGSLRDGGRESLMPITRSHPLDEVIGAAEAHAATTGRSPMLSYVLLAGVNDEDEDAMALARLALGFAARTGRKPRLSIIPFNPIAGTAYRRPTDERVKAFRASVHAQGVGTGLRYSGGGDIGAACGQLAGAPLGNARD